MGSLELVHLWVALAVQFAGEQSMPASLVSFDTHYWALLIGSDMTSFVSPPRSGWHVPLTWENPGQSLRETSCLIAVRVFNSKVNSRLLPLTICLMSSLDTDVIQWSFSQVAAPEPCRLTTRCCKAVKLCKGAKRGKRWYSSLIFFVPASQLCDSTDSRQAVQSLPAASTRNIQDLRLVMPATSSGGPTLGPTTVSFAQAGDMQSCCQPEGEQPWLLSDKLWHNLTQLDSCQRSLDQGGCNSDIKFHCLLQISRHLACRRLLQLITWQLTNIDLATIWDIK